MGRIVETVNKNDGHIYYVIQADGKTRAYVGIVFLEGYDNLSDHRGEPGLFFVREAGAKVIYKDGEPYSEQNGDPTVHSGWAMYCWDAQKDGPNKGNWRKVAEQESVDGPWGIDELILNLLVKKVDFNLFKTSVDERITKNARDIKNLQISITNITTDVESLKRDQHNHSNKAVLDALNDKSGQLTYKDRVISGNTFLYNYTMDNVLYWVDPTYVPTEEEPVAPAEVVVNSSIVAEKFGKTSLATVGMTLEVVEADGSISKYDYIEGEDEEHRKILVPKFRETTVQEGYGTITYVSTLPEESLSYDNRGIWCPLMDDGEHTPNTFYISKYGEWVEFYSALGKGSKLTYVGASTMIAFTETDPDMPFKKNHLVWKEPESPWQDPATLLTHSWAKTTLVRKFGSAPTSIKDGTIVMVNEEPGICSYVDVCQYSNEPVYYQLFSETKVGAYCTCSSPSGIVPSFLSWNDIFNFMERYPENINLVVNPGDVVVLPDHPKFGKISCVVLAATASNVIVASKDILDVLAFGSTSDYESSDLKEWLELNFADYTRFVKTSLGRADGRTLKIFDDEVGFVDLEIDSGDELPEAVDVYEENTEYPSGIIKKVEIPSSATTPCYDDLPTDTHYNGEIRKTSWWTADAIGSKVKLGDNPSGVAPTEEYGAIVVFTLGKAV